MPHPRSISWLELQADGLDKDMGNTKLLGILLIKVF